jgi:hypothetical protein
MHEEALEMVKHIHRAHSLSHSHLHSIQYHAQSQVDPDCATGAADATGATGTGAAVTVVANDSLSSSVAATPMTAMTDSDPKTWKLTDVDLGTSSSSSSVANSKGAFH